MHSLSSKRNNNCRKAFAVKPKKSLGQHFLNDQDIAKRISDTADTFPTLPLLEVGPGMGALTQFLVQKPGHLLAIEMDCRAVDYICAHFPSFVDMTNSQEGPLDFTDSEHPKRYIIHGDFLKTNLKTLFNGQKFVLIGNYPYDISSQIFFKLIENRELISCCTGMIQREVAQRIVSNQGSRERGILSVLLQTWYNIEYLFTVNEHVFTPPPKVKSAVVRLIRNKTVVIGCNEELFLRTIKTAFNQRRKMLRTSLRQIINPQTATNGFYKDEIMSKRPEQLSVNEFITLTNRIEEQLALHATETPNLLGYEP